MDSKLEATDTHIAALESSLKNQEAFSRHRETTLKEHSTQLLDHSAKLGSLMSGVEELTKSVALMHSEMRDGFLQHFQQNWDKKKIESGNAQSLESSFIITCGRNLRHNINEWNRSGSSGSHLKDQQLVAGSIKLPSFKGEVLEAMGPIIFLSIDSMNHRRSESKSPSVSPRRIPRRSPGRSPVRSSARSLSKSSGRVPSKRSIS